MQLSKNDPLTPERIQAIYMPNRSHLITNPRIVGDTLQAHICTACGTEAGEGMAKEIIGNKLKPAFSCRAIANMKLINNKPTVIVKRVITYDWVLFPSHARAHITSAPEVYRESGDFNPISSQDVMIPLMEILEMAGKKDPNLNMVMESFNLTLENVVDISNDHNFFMVRDKDNMLYVNMHPQTKKDVDEYFSSI